MSTAVEPVNSKNLMDRCFKEQMASEEWQAKLKQMIPSHGKSLAKDPTLTEEIRRSTSEVLGLDVAVYTTD